jgi:hypothetical protein
MCSRSGKPFPLAAPLRTHWWLLGFNSLLLWAGRIRILQSLKLQLQLAVLLLRLTCTFHSALAAGITGASAACG